MTQQSRKKTIDRAALKREESRLRWLCRRGMKELDMVMAGYLDSHYAKASEAEKNGFKTLLDMPDPDLYALLLGRRTSPDHSVDSVARCIRNLFKQPLDKS